MILCRGNRSGGGLALLIVLCAARIAHGQETVFDVPSADVLGKGKVYGELDGTVRVVDPYATFTPRVVVGIGRSMDPESILMG